MIKNSSHFWEKHIGIGRCKVSIIIYNTGEGIQVVLTGGELPHIGGIVLAVPRKSLDIKKTAVSSDFYILPLPGHKDVEAARVVAKILVEKLGVPVVVTAGIHSENMTPSEIELVIKHCEKLAVDACSYLAG